MSRSAYEIHLLFLLISDIYCGWPTNLGLLDGPSVFSRGSTVRHPLITKLRPMNEFGRVTVTTKLGPAIIVLWLIFSRSNSTMTGAGIEPATSSTKVIDYTIAPPLLKFYYNPLLLINLSIWLDSDEKMKILFGFCICISSIQKKLFRYKSDIMKLLSA